MGTGGVAKGGAGGTGGSISSTDFCPSAWCWSHPLPQGTGAGAIWVAGADDVWIGGEGGTFTRWNGKDWQYFSAEARFGQAILSIWGSGPKDLWATNGDELFRFDGSAWRAFASPAGSAGAPFFQQISGSGASDVWLASDLGLYHFTGSAFAPAVLPNLSFRWVAVASPDEAWAISFDNQLFRFNGTGWAAATFPSSAPQFQDLWAAGVGNLWLVESGAAWHWDGHAFTQNTELGTGTGFLYHQNLFGAGPDDVWLLSPSGILHRTSTGVSTIPFDQTGGAVPRAAMGTANGGIWATGQWGRVWHLEDKSFALATPPLVATTVGDLRSVWSDGKGATFAVGNAWIEHSSAGWKSSTIATGVVEADAVWGRAADDVWAVGSYATIEHFDGKGWSPVDAGVPDAAKSKLHLYAVGGTDSEMWAVGQSGQVVHYDGQKYEVGTSASVADLRAIWVRNADDVWAAGQAGTVQRWKRGSGWAKIASTPSAALNGLWGRSETDVWAVASTSGIYHFDGNTWSTVAGPAGGTSQVLNAIAGAADGTLWAVGAAGTILQYSGGAWKLEATRIASDLLGVAVGTGGEVWAVGKKHFVLRRSP
jgi:hypothetical protein